MLVIAATISVIGAICSLFDLDQADEFPYPAQAYIHDTVSAVAQLREMMPHEHDAVERVLRAAAGLPMRHLIARGVPTELSRIVKWRPSLETIEIRVSDGASVDAQSRMVADRASAP